MDLRSGIEFIRRQEKELVLFNLAPSSSVPEKLRELFQSQNVRIETARTASGYPEVAVLSRADKVLAVVEITLLQELTANPPTGAGGFGIADAEFEPILRHLKETTFSSYSKEQLLYASREIEDRARRVGRGTIHAGFQRLSIMAEQEHVYRDVARRGVSVHAYGQPDTESPDFGPAQIHTTDAAEITETWFVIFDGGGDDCQKSALLAEKQSNGWFGIWTYDEVIVDELSAYLLDTYVDPPGDTQLSGQ